MQRRAQSRRRYERDGPPVMRRRGRVAAAPRERPTIAQLCEEAGEQSDTLGQGIDMRVPVSDWAMALEALNHMHSAETNLARRDATMEALWDWKGDSEGEDDDEGDMVNLIT